MCLLLWVTISNIQVETFMIRSISLTEVFSSTIYLIVEHVLLYCTNNSLSVEAHKIVDLTDSANALKISGRSFKIENEIKNKSS